VLVAPLGVEAGLAGAAPEVQDRPYFLCLGTIEPRKNHLLLLHVWRSLAGDADAPRLILVGRRGWENENVVDMLERSDAIRGLVVEAGRVGDARLAGLVAGARAVLMPSFAEGFGLPVAEALAAGTPVIASDLPALRETGGGVPDYLDPLDGPGWRAALLDYARSASPRRAAQLERLASWTPPRWDDHFARVLPFLDAL
jgi:glycosyltransferase involved in cell wall biosynthesis